MSRPPIRTSGAVIVTGVPAIEPALLTAAAAFDAATVHEAVGRTGSLGSDIRPIQTSTRIVGRAVTVSCHPGDNLMIHAAVEQCGAGDILVVAHTAPSDHGVFGELLATSLRARGVVGLVVDAGVRDTDVLRSMGFPVWSRHVSVQGTVKGTAGSVNTDIVIGRQVVQAGDLVIADDDGVVVVPRPDISWALEQSRARVTQEDEVRTRLANGELGLDVHGLRATLESLGVERVQWEETARRPTSAPS